MIMSDEQIVRNKFPVVNIHQRLTDKHYEIWVNNLALGDGYSTIEEAWKQSAAIVNWWSVDRREEIMNSLVKQLTGYDNTYSRT